MREKPQISVLLKSALKRKQAAQPGYSLRALARDLGVSAPFLSKILNGEKAPPRERLQRLCHLLELDLHEKEAVVKAVLLDKFTMKVLGRVQGTKKVAGAPRRTTDVPSKTILSSWMNLAVLEGITLDPPFNDVATLQARLGLSDSELQRTLRTLESASLIESREGGGWQKKDIHLYVAGGRSRAEVRAFHEMMMGKAKEEMLLRPAEEDYQRRLINGFTLALDPSQFDRLKTMIVEFLDVLSREASSGSCSEVYQCNLQFFPLTRKS